MSDENHTEVGVHYMSIAIGLGLAHLLVEFSSVWSPIGGVFIVGLWRLLRGQLE